MQEPGNFLRCFVLTDHADDFNFPDRKGHLKNTFDQINVIKADNSKNNYEKAWITGTLLAGVANEIVKADNIEVKKSGIKVINSFLNIAKETQDQQLINTAVKISDSIPLNDSRSNEHLP